MKFSSTAALVASLFLTGTEATWCKFFYDNECTKTSNGTPSDSSKAESYDCANPGTVGTGGSYVQCHSTSTNHDTCYVKILSASTDGTTLGTTAISLGGPAFEGTLTSSCVLMQGGSGPWVSLTFDKPNGF